MAKAKKPGTALMTMADLERLYAEEAKIAAKAAPVAEGRPRISTKSEQFTVGETFLSDPLEVIVVAEALLNTYYDRPYDSEATVPPACFAIGAAVENGATLLHAHPSSPVPQGGDNENDCATCPKNAFGSAEIGKGKACANTRQLAVVLADDPALLDDSELKWATLPLSATALSPWGKFVAGLDKIVHRPPHGVVVQFSFNKKDPDERKRKAVIAMGYKLITDVRVATKINALRKTILEGGELVRPLPVDGYVPPGEKPTKAPKGRPAPVEKKKGKARAARF